MRLILPLLLFVSVANADTRSDLIATLRGFSGEAPIRARVEVEDSTQEGDAYKPAASPALGAALVTVNTDGLHILWGRDQLAALGEDGASGVGAGPKEALRAMESLTISRLNTYLNAAPDMLRVLDDGTVTAEEPATWHGQAARLVTLKLTPKIDEKSRKYVKELEAVARIWLGADGVPLAADRRLRVKGRAMLVISFESTEEESFEFAPVADRLVVVQHSKQSRGSGAGEQSQRRSAARLVLDPPPSA